MPSMQSVQGASPGSFRFAGHDMYAEFGIMLIPGDVLMPKLRPRKQTIPLRDGAYDFGANYYNERELTLNCDTKRGLTRADIRELMRVFAHKGQLYIWNEPDKYYIGRLYDPAPLRYLGSVGHEFALKFICDPFAYGAQYSGSVTNPMQYNGTAKTPTYITIRNTGASTIHDLTVRMRSISG